MSSIIFISSISYLINNAMAGVEWSWQLPTSDPQTWGRFFGTAPACGAHAGDCGKDNSGPYYWYSVTSGTGRYCSSGNKVYCNHYLSPYSYLKWEGTAPWCEASCASCADGTTCIALDGSGDGYNCEGFGTNQKAFCVDYAPQNVMLTSPSQRPVPSLNSVKGVEMGFYLYLGDELSDNSILQRNLAVTGSVILSTANVLNELVPDATTDAVFANISDYGYVAGSSHKYDKEYDSEFSNAQLIPFMNMKFKYKNYLDAVSVQTYLADLVKLNNAGQISEAITTAFGEKLSSFVSSNCMDCHFIKDLDFKLIFVESNYFY